MQNFFLVIISMIVALTCNALTPEQKRAEEKITKAFAQGSERPKAIRTASAEYLLKNSIYCGNFDFKDLRIPRGWNWNQSRKKICLPFSNGYISSLAKYTPRPDMKIKDQIPSSKTLKIWFATVEIGEEEIDIVWTEHGFDRHSEIEKYFNDNLDPLDPMPAPPLPNLLLSPEPRSDVNQISYEEEDFFNSLLLDNSFEFLLSNDGQIPRL